jgi:hypothetical protein
MLPLRESVPAIVPLAIVPLHQRLWLRTPTRIIDTELLRRPDHELLA